MGHASAVKETGQYSTVQNRTVLHGQISTTQSSTHLERAAITPPGRQGAARTPRALTHCCGHVTQRHCQRRCQRQCPVRRHRPRAAAIPLHRTTGTTRQATFGQPQGTRVATRTRMSSRTARCTAVGNTPAVAVGTSAPEDVATTEPSRAATVMQPSDEKHNTYAPSSVQSTAAMVADGPPTVNTANEQSDCKGRRFPQAGSTTRTPFAGTNTQKHERSRSECRPNPPDPTRAVLVHLSATHRTVCC